MSDTPIPLINVSFSYVPNKDNPHFLISFDPSTKVELIDDLDNGNGNKQESIDDPDNGNDNKQESTDSDNDSNFDNKHNSDNKQEPDGDDNDNDNGDNKHNSIIDIPLEPIILTVEQQLSQLSSRDRLLAETTAIWLTSDIIPYLSKHPTCLPIEILSIDTHEFKSNKYDKWSKWSVSSVGDNILSRLNDSFDELVLFISKLLDVNDGRLIFRCQTNGFEGDRSLLLEELEDAKHVYSNSEFSTVIRMGNSNIKARGRFRIGESFNSYIKNGGSYTTERSAQKMLETKRLKRKRHNDSKVLTIPKWPMGCRGSQRPTGLIGPTGCVGIPGCIEPVPYDGSPNMWSREFMFGVDVEDIIKYTNHGVLFSSRDIKQSDIKTISSDVKSSDQELKSYYPRKSNANTIALWMTLCFFADVDRSSGPEYGCSDNRIKFNDTSLLWYFSDMFRTPFWCFIDKSIEQLEDMLYRYIDGIGSDRELSYVTFSNNYLSFDCNDPSKLPNHNTRGTIDFDKIDFPCLFEVYHNPNFRCGMSCNDKNHQTLTVKIKTSDISEIIRNRYVIPN